MGSFFASHSFAAARRLPMKGRNLSLGSWEARQEWQRILPV